MSGEPPPSDVKSAARSLIRQLRDSNFSTWYSHLGPYQALKLQEEHARQIAPVVGPGAADSVDSAAAGAAAASERGEAAEASIVGYIRNDDGSVQRLKIPEKDVRLKAILYLQRFQRYLEDLPSRQVKPPKSKAIGMPKGTTVGDALGEIGRLEDALNEGLVEPENVAAVLLQAGRLRDFVGDAKLCRKRLKRLISGGVALPSQRMEAHRIIVSSLLRSGADADEAQASAVQHHVNEWLALTAPEYMAGTLRECTHWLRDRLHLDRFRMALLEEWSKHEMAADAERLARGVLRPPNAEVFIELAFHAIRQEAYPDALRWISAVIELCPGCVEQLDTVLQTTTAVSQLPTALGGLAPSDDAMHGPNGAVFRSLFYSGHMKREKRKDGRDKAAMAASGGRSEEEKREAIKRAIAAATVNFITPGPGHYHTAIGHGDKQVLSGFKNAPVYQFGVRRADTVASQLAQNPGPDAYDTRGDLGADAPAASFQSRTLFGSVYAAEVRHKLGMPAPTSYTPDDYSHARARWRATDVAKKVLGNIEPKASESIPALTVLAPTMLRHTDYSIDPLDAGSVLPPPERVAPAQVGRRPVPPLPDDVKIGSDKMMAGDYTGYSVASTIRPGKAAERVSKLTAAAAAAAAAGGKYVPALGGALVEESRYDFSALVQRPSSRMRPTTSGSLGSSISNAPSVTSGAGSAQSPVRPPSPVQSMGKRKPSSPGSGVSSRVTSVAGGMGAPLAPAPAVTGSGSSKRLDPLQEIAREYALTGHVPAPRLRPGGAMTHASRWRDAEMALERAAELPGPGAVLPPMPSGPAYSILGKADSIDGARSSATEGDGGGPGVCRYDSAFGKQVSSILRSAPAATFDSRETSSNYAPVLNLRSIQAGDDVNDHPVTQADGMRRTIMTEFDARGMPGVGAYDTTRFDIAAQSAARYAEHTKALYHARASAAKRMYK